MAKKIIKISLCALLFSGLVALLVCYCVIPQETKSAIDIVIEYVNTPFGITGISIATFLVFAYKLFQLTSFGKKAINQAKEEVAKLEKKHNQLNKEYGSLVELQQKYEEQVAILINGFDERVDFLFAKLKEIANTIPNAKINALVDEFEFGYKAIKEKTSDYVEGAKKYSAKDIEELESEVARLTKLLEKVVKENEEQETTNN